MQIAKQARNEGGQKLFQIFRQGENEVNIASLARWDTQLKGLVELERRCQDLMQEVNLLSERQEVLIVHGGGQEGHAERSSQKVSRERFSTNSRS